MDPAPRSDFHFQQMFEKFYEHDTDIHMLFIDLKEAFDSIKTGEVYEVMLRMRIPVNIIKIAWMTMDNNSAKLKLGINLVSHLSSVSE
jgi:hypothetical protein